jgi:hypothetical protein
MQTVNRDRLCANSRITLTAFVEGAYLPWTKEERRASTSKGHHEIWNNHLRDRVGKLRLWEFRTVDASRMLRAIAKEKDLTRTTLQHIRDTVARATAVVVAALELEGHAEYSFSAGRCVQGSAFYLLDVQSKPS